MMQSHLVITFFRLGPYHEARLSAAAKLGTLTALEVSSDDANCPWDADRRDGTFRRGLLLGRSFVQGMSARDIRRSVESVLDELRPDVVAVPGWSEPFALALLDWCGTRRVPAVLMTDSHALGRRNSYREWLKRRLVGNFESVFSAGTAQVQYLKRLGVREERITLGYNVVENSHFSVGAAAARSDARSVRRRLGLPDRYFLSVCRFIPEKNLQTLIQSYARYREAARDEAWSLVLVGDGPQRREIENLKQGLGLHSALILPGARQYHELPGYYGLAGAVILPSKSETWGLVVNEAMAAGLPVLVSNRCGCWMDLVKEGENGYVFDPGHEEGLAALMTRMASDHDSLSAMGHASEQIISHWGPERFAQGLWAAAQIAVQQPRRRPSLFDRILIRSVMARPHAAN